MWLYISTLQAIQKKLQSRQDEPWLIHFVEGQEGRHLELRKLPAMLSDIQVCILKCSYNSGEITKQTRQALVDTFCGGPRRHLELKKLPAMLSDIQVYRKSFIEIGLLFLFQCPQYS